VRAWDDVLSLLKKEGIKAPVVFHGFNKNEVLAKKITSTGYYLSFGKALQYDQARLAISAVPIDKILLETDDADIHIETIYEMAAQALSIDINLLSLQIQKNAAAFFGAAATGI
jgi:TatD DNase family protein